MFSWQQARLSPWVEADPDCKAAIDMLGFALYHENTQVVGDRAGASSGDADSRKRKHGSMTSNTEEDKANEERVEAMSEEEVLRSLKARIWDQLSKEGEGELTLEEAVPDVTDRDLVGKALAEMEKDDRVMIGEGIIFQI